jgi:ABC-type multidrug transport system ATPase subunit
MAAGLMVMNAAGRGAKVTLSDLEKSYDRAAAVAGVSLDIDSGEFLTLLGPSGSGKTTTLMMIAGFETPTRGDIAIDGKSVVAKPPQRRHGIPELRAVSPSHRGRQHRICAETARRRQGRAGEAGRRGA